LRGVFSKNIVVVENDSAVDLLKEVFSESHKTAMWLLRSCCILKGISPRFEEWGEFVKGVDFLEGMSISDVQNLQVTNE